MPRNFNSFSTSKTISSSRVIPEPFACEAEEPYCCDRGNYSFQFSKIPGSHPPIVPNNLKSYHLGFLWKVWKAKFDVLKRDEKILFILWIPCKQNPCSLTGHFEGKEKGDSPPLPKWFPSWREGLGSNPRGNSSSGKASWDPLPPMQCPSAWRPKTAIDSPLPPLPPPPPFHSLVIAAVFFLLSRLFFFFLFFSFFLTAWMAKQVWRIIQPSSSYVCRQGEDSPQI